MEQAFPEMAQTIGIWKHPLVVDAPSDVCLGWFLYSTHKMHSEDYKQALTETLRQQKIVIDPSLLGLKWRAIAHPNGQRPKWNKEDPNPSALHLYVAKDYDYLVRKKVGQIYATPKSNGANKLYHRFKSNGQNESELFPANTPYVLPTSIRRPTGPTCTEVPLSCSLVT